MCIYAVGESNEIYIYTRVIKSKVRLLRKLESIAVGESLSHMHIRNYFF